MKLVSIVVGAALTASPMLAQTTAAADSAFFAHKWKEAIAMYDKAIAANSPSLPAHAKAGYAALALGTLDVAEQHFKAVVAGAPNGAPNAYAGMAIIHAKRGNAAAALDALEHAVTAGYIGLNVLDSEPAFKPLRANEKFVSLHSRVEQTVFPCLKDSAARSFDFWVGDWDVYVNGSNQKAGTNKIERVAEGCAILESWVATTGVLQPPQNGKSLNYIDPATGKWRQVWMGSGRGQNDYVNGAYSDGAMRFTYERKDAQGNPLRGRFTFFNLGPNRVRQIQEQTRDGQTYQTVYDFIYVRKGSSEKP